MNENNTTKYNDYIIELKYRIKDLDLSIDDVSEMFSSTCNYTNSRLIADEVNGKLIGGARLNLLEIFLTNESLVDFSSKEYNAFIRNNNFYDFNTTLNYMRIQKMIELNTNPRNRYYTKHALKNKGENNSIDTYFLDLVNFRGLSGISTKQVYSGIILNKSLTTMTRTPLSALQYLFGVDQYKKGNFKEGFLKSKNFIMPYQNDLTDRLLCIKPNLRSSVSKEWLKFVNKKTPELETSNIFQMLLKPNGIKRILMSGQTEGLNENSKVVKSFVDFVDSIS